jgi:hypothetical protein
MYMVSTSHPYKLVYVYGVAVIGNGLIKVIKDSRLTNDHLTRIIVMLASIG